MLVSPKTKAKLKNKHNVDVKEVFECFLNRTAGMLVDSREDHKSNPPTQWFIAPTDLGRELKVCFIFSEGKVHLKSAFEPNATEKSIYIKKAQ
jgi:uncharacterized DUF497 family protein